MRWTFKLTRFLGIDIYVHKTFLLLLAWFGFQGFQSGGTLLAAVNSMAFIAALFGCVVLHEYGHALAARYYGIKTKHITLLPIGGVAAIASMPQKPWQEFVIAIAGPLVNFVLAGALFFILINQNEPTPFAQQLLWVNLVLGIFNLIPAFPMDGGRILRAILAAIAGPVKATQWASVIGKAFAALFAIYGLYSQDYMLALIGAFIWLGASGENKMMQYRQQVKQLSIEHIMLKQFTILNGNDSLLHAQTLTHNTGQQDFPVGNRQHISHVLSQHDLQQALTMHDQHQLIDSLSLDEVLSIDINTSIEQLISQLKATPYKMIAVMKNGKVAGTIGMQQVLALSEL